MSSITSLLELEEQKAKQANRISQLLRDGLTDSVEFEKAEWQLKQTEQLIKNWGMEGAVYRIC